MRASYHAKEGDKKMKQKMRDRMQPKMGKLDIDYAILHDAFFKHQRPPTMSSWGELYYEGKEFEPNVRTLPPSGCFSSLFPHHRHTVQKPQTRQCEPKPAGGPGHDPWAPPPHGSSTCSATAHRPATPTSRSQASTRPSPLEGSLATTQADGASRQWMSTAIRCTATCLARGKRMRRLMMRCGVL